MKLTNTDIQQIIEMLEEVAKAGKDHNEGNARVLGFLAENAIAIALECLEHRNAEGAQGKSSAEFDTIVLRRLHDTTWRDKPETYWLARLMQEVGELASALVGDHDDPPEHELMQIAAICINWLDMRGGDA